MTAFRNKFSACLLGGFPGTTGHWSVQWFFTRDNRSRCYRTLPEDVQKGKRIKKRTERNYCSVQWYVTRGNRTNRIVTIWRVDCIVSLIDSGILNFKLLLSINHTLLCTSLYRRTSNWSTSSLTSTILPEPLQLDSNQFPI